MIPMTGDAKGHLEKPPQIGRFVIPFGCGDGGGIDGAAGVLRSG